MGADHSARHRQRAVAGQDRAYLVALFVLLLITGTMDFNDQVQIESEDKARHAAAQRVAELAPKLKFAHVWAR